MSEVDFIGTKDLTQNSNRDWLPSIILKEILESIQVERERQDAKFDFTDAVNVANLDDRNATIVAEEYLEFLEEINKKILNVMRHTNDDKFEALEKELLEVATCCVKWLQIRKIKRAMQKLADEHEAIKQEIISTTNKSVFCYGCKGDIFHDAHDGPWYGW
ncbi:MAG TPA: hypothetical protein VIH61_02155 [Waddliaceae bacterium]